MRRHILTEERIKMARSELTVACHELDDKVESAYDLARAESTQVSSALADLCYQIKEANKGVLEVGMNQLKRFYPSILELPYPDDDEYPWAWEMRIPLYVGFFCFGVLIGVLL